MEMSHPRLLHTKLMPPRPARNLLRRARVMELVATSAEFPLTLLLAGPGYGKSTVLTALLADNCPTAWLSLEEEDSTPQRFLTYLVHSFARISAELTRRPVALLEQQPDDNPTAILDALLNAIAAWDQPLRLVIDDAQTLNNRPETLALLERFLAHIPTCLTTLVATRHPLDLPLLNDWHLRGNLLTIDRQALAFSHAELLTLFNDTWRQPLTPQQAAQLIERTEGWPIVLPLIHRRLQQSETIDTALETLSASGGNLFQFLTQQVLERLSAETRHFLRTTAVLRHLDPAICDYVRGATDSATYLRQLRETGLFVTVLDGSRLRYHHLFRDLLYHQLAAPERVVAHERAGRFLVENGDAEGAIEQFVAAGNSAEIARLLDQHGHNLIAAGRLHSVAAWIGGLQPEQLTVHPNLLLQLGDIARLQSRFDSALAWYEQAETHYRSDNNRLAAGRALRGQARVYLDTVRPAQAEKLLQEALKLADGQEDRAGRARLLDLLAENLLNQGHVEQAQTYQRQARQLLQEGPSSAEIPVRLMLRTGRLHTARQILETRAEQERADPILRPRSHRETLLLLSLIAAMQGDHKTAMRCAREGTDRARQFDSPFTLSVGYMRQGAAWLLHKNEAGYVAAQRCFEQAIDVSNRLDLPRLRVEALWGLTQVHGFQGRVATALESAETAIKIARAAGDQWIAACIELTLGASLVLADHPDRARTALANAAPPCRRLRRPSRHCARPSLAVSALATAGRQRAA